MFSGLTDAISREKVAWKGLHQSIIQLDRLGGTGVECTTVDSINSIICPNYLAFQERLLYFQTELNGLLFTNLIPMDMIHSLFLTYFSLSDCSTAHFNKPHKAYCYADISLITAVVYVVVIFTQNSTHVFHHQLPASFDQLSSLALSLFNLSKFKRKKTHQVLLSLIVVRTGLFVFDNAERMNELTGTYQTFQLVLDLCYQMGLYTDPDTTSIVMLKEKTKARLLSGSRVRELWNYMQTQDAFYSLKMGTPLLINYDFCQGFYRSSDLPFEGKREEGVMLMRELSIIINSPRPVSIRDLLDVIHKVIQYCRPDNEGIDDLDEVAYLFKQRLILAQSLEFLFRMAIVGIRDLNGPDELSRELFRQLALSAVTILYQIREVFSGKTVFGEDRNGKYIVYFKDVFARSLGQSFLTWFTFLLPSATENSVLLGELERQAMIFEYPTEAPYLYEIDLRVLERALYHEENVELGEQLFARIINSSELMAFATTFYDLLCQSDVMKSSLNSFLTIKLVIIWAYVVQTFEECKGMGIRPSVPEIIRRARGKVEADFSSGRLDTKKFVSEGEELEQILDSIFEDEWMRG
ncbi:DEKNAAC103175 [Brettanomyces naardenensis]|uniref:DEKNAAC103175 n=1 Tax=Brettanomyces naardenensis TaxID=13370 RepID=A0A448YMR2_BRENA|nr:DEKNAAC103175 [Brettanomyces naardenensis]